MDTPETPKRRWWRKKRWWAALALWLVIAYPLSVGPLWGLMLRGWLPRAAWKPLHCYSRPHSAIFAWQGHSAADTMIRYYQFWLPRFERPPRPHAKPAYADWKPGDLPPLPAP